MDIDDILNTRGNAAAAAAAAAAEAHMQQQLQQSAHLNSRGMSNLAPNPMPTMDQQQPLHQVPNGLNYASYAQNSQSAPMLSTDFITGQQQPPNSRHNSGGDLNGPRTHSEPAPKQFACSTCSKGFARRSDLARHERIHSGVRPHVCEYPNCNKQFIQRSALTVHQRVHTGEKPHMCERCGKPFSDSSSLARHRRIHSGKRPYKCPYANCQKTFTRRTTLTRHQNHHTGTIEEAAAETSARLLNTNGASGSQADGDFSDAGSSPNSGQSPTQRQVTISPANELPSIPQMPGLHRQSSDFSYIPQNGSLPPHMRNDFQQNSPRASPGLHNQSMNYTSMPHHRPSMTSHPNAYGPPQPLEPPANGINSATGSPHMAPVGWGSPTHGNLPSPGPIDVNYGYADPTYGGGHPMYYPGSNIRRPQSTEPENYGIRPRNEIHHQQMSNQMPLPMSSHAMSSNHLQIPNHVPMGAHEWSSMPIGGGVGMQGIKKEDQFVL